MFLSSLGTQVELERGRDDLQCQLGQGVIVSVAWVVEYGLQHRSLDGVTAIGVDEVQFQKGHRYLTVVYQINAECRRLLWVGQDRSTKNTTTFFQDAGRRANSSYPVRL